MGMKILALIGILLASSVCADEPRFVIGTRNSALADGAIALLHGKHEEGIRLTLAGLAAANGKQEEEIALSNLCAGYTNLGAFQTALKYCDNLLHRNEKNWRAHNSKALIYIYTKQYEKAELSLVKAEALNPGARSLKIARGMFLDATQPVTPEIEVDDRRPGNLPQ